MSQDYISPEEQRQVIKKLYRSDDSISSLEKFNAQYQAKIGPLGERTLTLTDFARCLKQTHFPSFEVEKFTTEVTKQASPDLENL